MHQTSFSICVIRVLYNWFYSTPKGAMGMPLADAFSRRDAFGRQIIEHRCPVGIPMGVFFLKQLKLCYLLINYYNLQIIIEYILYLVIAD